MFYYSQATPSSIHSSTRTMHFACFCSVNCRQNGDNSHLYRYTWYVQRHCVMDRLWVIYSVRVKLERDFSSKDQSNGNTLLAEVKMT